MNVNNSFTLVILAAGLGSRFGGLKQLTPITDHNECIIDFSIYDAIASGAKEIILVIRKATEKQFKTHFKEISDVISIKYVYQEPNDIPDRFLPTNRVKPWGTGHALLMLRGHITTNNFVMVNADDFYGSAAFKTASQLISKITANTYGIVPYVLKNTLSKHGAVSRGECFFEKGNLTNIIERTKISVVNDSIITKNGESLVPQTLVSMNFWVFHVSILAHLTTHFEAFLNTFQHDDKKEFFLPEVISALIENNTITVKSEATNSNWFGITYAEDLALAKETITRLKDQGTYPKILWKKK